MCFIRAAAALLFIFVAEPLRADWYWVEGEKPVKSSMNRHPWWYDQVKRGEFSGGDFISNFSDDKPGEAQYSVRAKKAGGYQLGIRRDWENPGGREFLKTKGPRDTPIFIG
nr:hypothetical protein Hi04_10k_c2220_00002 [uncultured bacterium]